MATQNGFDRPFTLVVGLYMKDTESSGFALDQAATYRRTHPRRSPALS